MKKVNWLSCLLLFGGFLYFSSASAVSIGFSPGSDTVNINDIFTIDVVISDLYAESGSGEREIVSAFDLDVIYDSTILSATAVSFGSSLGSSLSTDPFDLFSDAWIGSEFTSGRIDFWESSFLSNLELSALQLNDSFTLATLSFLAISEGASSLNFDPIPIPGVDVKGYDPFGQFDLSASTGEGSINVNAVTNTVPEPGTLLLVIIGFLGLVSGKRLGQV